jgi:hypothetical protein
MATRSIGCSVFTVYTLFVGRALHLLRGEGILVWNSVTSIDTWRTDYMYVLFVLKRTLHPVGGAGSLVQGDSN